MKKKILFLFLVIFILSGCSVTYDLNVENFKEEISVTPTTSEDLELINHYPMDDSAYYTDSDNPDDLEADEDISYYMYDLSDGKLKALYTFNDKYQYSNAANYCFPTLVVLKGKTIRLNTTSGIECFNYQPGLDNITINITVPYTVVNNNADSVNGNVYTWVFEREGSIKSINIEYNNPDYKSNHESSGDSNKKENKQDNNSEEKSNNKKDNSKYAFMLTGLFFVLLFAIIIFRNKLKL